VGAVALPAAATPVPDQKPAAVAEQRDGLAACWRTAKAQMAATLNTSEARAQRQVWVTDSGRVCIGEQFKAELAETFPLVDLTAGLAAAAPNVNPDHGALTAQKQILRQFGYMQQDALRRAAGAAARQPAPNALPPVKSFADRETESHNAWVRREAEKIRQRGPILPREEQPA
jgi:hypothetical protein